MHSPRLYIITLIFTRIYWNTGKGKFNFVRKELANPVTNVIIDLQRQISVIAVICIFQNAKL